MEDCKAWEPVSGTRSVFPPSAGTFLLPLKPVTSCGLRLQHPHNHGWQFHQGVNSQDAPPSGKLSELTIHFPSACPVLGSSLELPLVLCTALSNRMRNVSSGTRKTSSPGPHSGHTSHMGHRGTGGHSVLHSPSHLSFDSINICSCDYVPRACWPLPKPVEHTVKQTSVVPSHVACVSCFTQGRIHCCLFII